MGSVTSHSVNYRDRALRSLGKLPLFSPILNKLLATLAKEDVSFAELAELIEKDTVLAGNVLRLVNSALYRRRGTINSVRHAVSLMGLVKLRNSVMTLSVSSMWNQVKTPRGWSQARFNLHAIATAVLADLLAQKIQVDYPEGAFIAGLLHDIGMLLIAISLPDEFEAIRELYEAGGRSIEECEKELIGLDHTELSTAALKEWNIPEPISRAVQDHHSPELSSNGVFRLSRVLQVAEQVVDSQGVCVLQCVHAPDTDPHQLLEPLGVSLDAPALLEEFHREFESIKKFF